MYWIYGLYFLVHVFSYIYKINNSILKTYSNSWRSRGISIYLMKPISKKYLVVSLEVLENPFDLEVLQRCSVTLKWYTTSGIEAECLWSKLKSKMCYKLYSKAQLMVELLPFSQWIWRLFFRGNILDTQTSCQYLKWQLWQVCNSYGWIRQNWIKISKLNYLNWTNPCQMWQPCFNAELNMLRSLDLKWV